MLGPKHFPPRVFRGNMGNREGGNPEHAEVVSSRNYEGWLRVLKVH
jgi:hypothetical protein